MAIKNIIVDWGFMLEVPGEHVMMGEAAWILNDEDMRLLNKETNMNISEKDLVTTQNKISNAIREVFGNRASLDGLRFLPNGILVKIHIEHDPNDAPLGEAVTLPYECLYNESYNDTDAMIDCMVDELENRKKKTDESTEDESNPFLDRFKKVN